MKRVLIAVGVGLVVSYMLSPYNFQAILLKSRKNLEKQLQKKAQKQINTTTKRAQKTLEKQSESVALNTKNKLQDTLSEATQKINETLEEKTQQVLGEVLHKDAETAPTVIPISGDVADDAEETDADGEVITPVSSLVTRKIDFLTNKGLRLNFKKGKTYKLDLINVPEDFCLFVNSNKYELEDAEYVKITFTTNGTYDVQFDYCQQSAKHFGEIVVE